jgi:hypothetical protein
MIKLTKKKALTDYWKFISAIAKGMGLDGVAGVIGPLFSVHLENHKNITKASPSVSIRIVHSTDGFILLSRPPVTRSSPRQSPWTPKRWPKLWSGLSRLRASSKTRWKLQRGSSGTRWIFFQRRSLGFGLVGVICEFVACF